MGKSLNKCPNGHFYDGGKFASCPFCEDGGNQGMIPTEDIGGGTGGKKTLPTGDWGGSGGGNTSSGGWSNEPSGGTPTAPPKDSGNNGGGNKKSSITDKFGEDLDKQKKETMQKTVSFFVQTGVKQPPAVGLLLCVEGGNFGQTYLLKSGKNFIGRSSSMDVVISEDQSVSREKHAIVLYEPKKRMFLAQPGESSELFYINDEVVLQAEALTIYDEITLGSTKLIFIPICCEQFAWDDYTK